MYQTLPRKYRPQVFSTVVGQEAIVTTLKNALKFRRIAHAYLFCGSRGTGKTTLARVFAKALNCQNITADFEPCNLCASCLEITAGRSLDVLEIDGASNRGIDDIRHINETIGYAPSSGKYKIYIIDEVHMLTKEAFNALLKTLEEPPPNVKFLFATTEPHKVLLTIISRCQRFDLNRISMEQIIQKLGQIVQDLGVVAEDNALELIAHLAEGGLRDAESLLDQLICYEEGPITYENIVKTLGLSSRTAYFSLDQAIHNIDHAFALKLSTEVFSTGKDLASFLEGLLEHFRTLLLLKLKMPFSTYLNENDRKTYITTAQLYTEEHILYILDYLIQWHKELSKTPFKRVLLEMILLHLIRSKKRISITTLIHRLQELYREGLKNRELSQEGSPDFLSGANSSAREHEASEDGKYGGKPTLNKTDFSVTSGIEQNNPKNRDFDKEAQSSEGMAIAQRQDTSENKNPNERESPKNLEGKLLNVLKKPLSSPKSTEVSTVEKMSSEPAEYKAKENEHTPSLAEKSEPKIDQTLKPSFHPSRYDTILKFAAVELEGTIKKD